MRQRKQLGDRNVVGARIRGIRVCRNMEQGDVVTQVELMGEWLTQSKLSRIEGQKSIVTDRDLIILSKVLNVPVGDLFPPWDSEKMEQEIVKL